MENEQKTNSILNSLDGIHKASPGHFFFTRVQAKLKKEEAGMWGNLGSFISKPRVALITLLVIFVLNTAAFLYQKEMVTPEQSEQTLTEDFNTTLAANSYYDENTEAH